MEQHEKLAIVQRLLAKGNKVSEKQMEEYGFVFDKGFDAYQIEGRCANGRVDLPDVDTLCLVRVGDPIVFEAYYKGEVDIIVVDNDYGSSSKRIVTLQVFEQDDLYAVVQTEEYGTIHDTPNHIDLTFEEVDIEPFVKSIE